VSFLGRRRKAADPANSEEDFLLKRAAPAWSMFAGTEVIEEGVILRWDTEYGTIGVVYSVPFSHRSVHRFVNKLSARYGPQLHKAYVSLVSTELTMGWYGPDLQAVDILRWGSVSDSYEPTCEDVVKIIGTPVPIWPSRLRDLETIEKWKPDSPPALVPAFDSFLPTEPFTALAADEPDDSLVAPVCLWLARKMRDADTEDAQSYIEMLKDVSKDYGDKWFTFGALPAEIRRQEAEPLPEEIRREGWDRLLKRRDTLAAKVAKLARMWDGGEDWLGGATARVYPKEGSTAATWAARLIRAPTDQRPTALEQSLLDAGDPSATDGLILRDPETEMPAIYFNKNAGDEYIATKVPFRIPTTEPLKSVILSGSTVWIITRDDRLWIAPERPGLGLSWGYGGSGPTRSPFSSSGCLTRSFRPASIAGNARHAQDSCGLLRTRTAPLPIRASSLRRREPSLRPPRIASGSERTTDHAAVLLITVCEISASGAERLPYPGRAL
jgi:hypothetical protein